MKKQRAKPQPKVERSCKACGKDFLIQHCHTKAGNGIFCSRECYLSVKKRPKVEQTCKRCDKVFLVRASAVNRGVGIFCSQECFNLDRIDKRPKVELKCKQCGTEFRLCQWEINQGRGVYCSQSCSHKAMARQQLTCKHCGLAFYGRPGSTFCSPKCTTESNRRPKVQRTCKQCKKDFSLNQSQVDGGQGSFCSRKCMGLGQRKPLPVSTCQCCGKVFTHKHSNLHKRKYCSKACAGKAVRGAGKKKRVGRPYQHEKWMLAVLNRDKKCVRCGAVENLQAHHLKSWKSHPALRDDISNGVALCVLCHHAQHPKLPLETFVASGGKSVQYCVVCEDGFVVRRKTQRTCSQKCGRELRKQRQPA